MILCYVCCSHKTLISSSEQQTKFYYNIIIFHLYVRFKILKIYLKQYMNVIKYGNGHYNRKWH